MPSFQDMYIEVCTPSVLPFSIMNSLQTVVVVRVSHTKRSSAVGCVLLRFLRWVSRVYVWAFYIFLLKFSGEMMLNSKPKGCKRCT